MYNNPTSDVALYGTNETVGLLYKEIPLSSRNAVGHKSSYLIQRRPATFVTNVTVGLGVKVPHSQKMLSGF